MSIIHTLNNSYNVVKLTVKKLRVQKIRKKRLIQNVF